MPNQFLKVDVSRVSERQGWLVQCVDPLQFMSLHIPEENRSAVHLRHPRGSGVALGHKRRFKNILFLISNGDIVLHIPSSNPDTERLCCLWGGGEVGRYFFPLCCLSYGNSK